MIFSISNWLIEKVLKSPKLHQLIEDKVLERFIPEPGLNEEEVMALIRGYCVGGSSPTPPSSNVSPVAAFTYSCDGLVCSFDASTSEDPDGATITYAWDFGDASGTATGVAADYTYAAEGDYTVVLTVTDNAAATDQDSEVVTVVENQIVISLVEGNPAGAAPLATAGFPTKPAQGATYTDPHYSVAGLTHRRVTDHAATTNADYLNTYYSRRQPFNADNTRLLLEDANQNFIVNPTTGAVEFGGQVYIGPNSSRPYTRLEPVWDYNDPDAMYALAFDPLASVPVEDDLFRVNKLDWGNVTGGVPARQVMIDFQNVNFSAPGYETKNSITQTGVFPTARIVWTRLGEGMPSMVTVDAGLTWAGAPRYWAFLVQDTVNSTNEFDVIGAITYDLQTNTVTGVLKFSEHGITNADHTSMSASGDYVQIGINTDCGSLGAVGTFASPCGGMVYNREFTSAFGYYRNASHSDFARDKNGDDVLCFVDANTGYIRYMDPATGTLEALVESGFPAGGADIHMSGNAFNQPGYLIWNQYDTSTASDPTTSDTWLDAIMMTEIVPDVTSSNPAATTWILGHTYNRHSGTDGSRPNVSPNHDLTKIAWGSNWDATGAGSATLVDVYVIEIDLDTYDLP